jgi:hypothetical protein
MRRVSIMLGVCILLSTDLWAVGPRVRRSCLIGWDAVTTNVDASALTDLAGYRLYTSTTSGSYGGYTLQVGSGTTQATCRQLGLTGHNQQYYVQVTAIDGEAIPNESAVSNELALVVTMGAALFR